MSGLFEQYKAWVLAQELEDCTLREKADGVAIDSDTVRGEVNFYDIDGYQIVELRLDRVADGEPVFFLHFELEDLGRAKALFDEMAAALHDATHVTVRHVLLSCTCGMTTGYFAQKLNEVAQGLGLDYDFCAKPIDEAKRSGSDYAAVLLAPQVGYQRKDLVEALPDVPVIELPGKLFGSYDAPGVMRLVVDALSGTRAATESGATLTVKRDYDRTRRVLALSYVHREDEPTLSYRVLDRGEVTISGMLVRRTLDIRTLEDLAATLRVRGYQMSDFDDVGIAVPGVVDGGVIIERRDGEELRFDLAGKLAKRWGVDVHVDYNACAAAVGCYVTQDEYENVAFHAQAIGVADGEEGYVVAGRPLMGRGGRSGHLGPLARTFTLGMDAEDAAWCVAGMRELVGRYLASLACTVAPDVVYVWCDLLPDMDELCQELGRTLAPAAVPKLVAVADYDECVLLGELALCMDRLAG